jgi:hypothetical protein
MRPGQTLQGSVRRNFGVSTQAADHSIVAGRKEPPPKLVRLHGAGAPGWRLGGGYP